MKIRFELKNIKKIYLKRLCTGGTVHIRVLNGANLKIFENTILSIRGPSGSGKSTLARILLNLETFDSGDLLYKGKDLSSFAKQEFRRKNQIMFQNPLLSVNPYFTIRRIISEPLKIARATEQSIKEKLDYQMHLLELPDSLLERYPDECSGGELQRVVLARSLILEPEFLILDEPFSALDEILAYRLLGTFRTIFKTLEIGVLYLSHHLNRIRFLSDKVTMLTDGKIIENNESTY
jgi:peptide/nickel transport system ATP-binding protein